MRGWSMVLLMTVNLFMETTVGWIVIHFLGLKKAQVNYNADKSQVVNEAVTLR